MLLDSPRLSERDRQIWAERSRGDPAYSRTSSHRRRIAEASDALLAFASAGPCYAGVSWGKDSTVLAHLVATLAPGVPLVWIRVEPVANPDCFHVRDSFRGRLPAAIYEEAEVRCEPDGKGGWHARGTLERGFAEAAKRYGDRHVSGIRAQESGGRAMRVARYGLGGDRTCAPLGRWNAADVWAYLAAHDLPIHPAYAMSLGGVLDRDRIRVASLGRWSGWSMGRRDWELRYYPDVMHRIGER